jgi:hypothetical protein
MLGAGPEPSVAHARNGTEDRAGSNVIRAATASAVRRDRAAHMR